DNQLDYYYSLPYDEQTIKFTLDSLASHTRKYCDCYFLTDNPTRDVLMDGKMTERKVYEMIGMSLTDPIPVPDNVIEFYELYTILKLEGNNDTYDYVVKSFRFSQAMKNHVNQMKTNLNQLYYIDKKISEGNTKLSSNLGYAIDRINYLRFLYDIGSIVCDDFGDRSSLMEMNDIMRRYENELRGKYLKYVQRLDKKSKAYAAIEGSLDKI